MKHVGILSHSFEGAALCYRELCLEGTRILGPHLHPEITMTGVAMHHMMESWRHGDLETLRDMFLGDIGKLAAAGADFFICPDNTAHIALESAGESFPIPCLHIGEVVAAQAERDGRQKVAVLGTEWTMTGPVYRGAFGRLGLDWEVPDETDRRLIQDVIFDQLCLGTFTRESRDAFVKIIDKMAHNGCDAVALVCTEIPLLVTEEASPLPLLDSTRLLARAALSAAIGGKLPGWRGGPLL